MTDGAEAQLMRVLHDQHAAALRSYALELTNGDRAHAEDVVQETLLRAWRHPKVLDQSERSARSWLLTVARRIAIDEWRSGTSRAEVMTDAPPEQINDDDTERAVQGWLVADAIAELSTRHREVLALCFYQGMSVADAAARLGVPEGTIKSRTHYALRALRLALEERGVTR